MKKPLLVSALLLATAGIVLVGCSGSNNPTNPSGGNPTSTPTATSTPGIFEWYKAQIYAGTAYGGLSPSSGAVYMELRYAGQPVTNAAVTLAGPGTLTAPLTFIAPVTESGFGNFAGYYAPCTYQAAQTYVLESRVGGGSASLTFVSPGGGVTLSPDGLSANWTHSGNFDNITVRLNSSFVAGFGPGIHPPFSIPASVYSAPGTYQVLVGPENTLGGAPASLNLVNNDYILESDLFTLVMTPCVSCTPTPTPSPTHTFTLAPTPTVTATPTATSVLQVWDGLVESSSGTGYSNLQLEANGLPVTNAAVTLTGPGTSLPIPYTGNVSYGATVVGNYSAGGFSYQAGQTYVISSQSSYGSGSISFYTPGGGVSVSPDGRNAYWNVEGNGDDVAVSYLGSGIYDYHNYSINANSPFSVPSTVYGSSSGSFTVLVRLDNNNTQVANLSIVPQGTGLGTHAVDLETVTLCLSSGAPCSAASNFSAQWGSSGTGPGHFNAPQGIAFDGSGNLWVADMGNNRLQKLPSGQDGSNPANWVTIGGTAASTVAGQFNLPQGMAVDPSGNLWVADTFNNRIQYLPAGLSPSVSGNWVVAGAAGTATGQFSHPTGAATDGSGNLYVADFANNRVQRLPFGQNPQNANNWSAAPFNSTTAGSGSGQFNQPKGLAFDGAGDLYAADYGNNRVMELPAGSGFNNQANAWITLGGFLSFNGPQEVALNTGGNLFAADTGNNRVQELIGSFAYTIGTAGSGNGQFNTPIGVAVDASGNLYVADSANNRIEVFTP